MAFTQKKKLKEMMTAARPAAAQPMPRTLKSGSAGNALKDALEGMKKRKPKKGFTLKNSPKY